MTVVRNKSEVSHRYRDRTTQINYNWGPGESKDVPPGISRLMITHHPEKFELVNPPAPSESPPESPPESGPVHSAMETEDYTQAVPDQPRSRGRSRGGNG